MSEELKPCPFCGFKGQVLWDRPRNENTPYHWVLYCAQCGALIKGSTALEVRTAWNRRTPEPMTSVVKWVRHDGTEETLPPIYRKVLLRNADSFAKIPMTGQSRRGNQWFFEDDTRRDIEIGDEWTYWPTQPELINAGS